MDNVVPLKKYYYPLILRVVLDKALYYHVAVIESPEPDPSFWIAQLRGIFKLKNDDDWQHSKIRDWHDATIALKKEIERYDGKFQVSPEGFFIIIRPRHGEILVMDHPRKLPQKELAQSA